MALLVTFGTVFAQAANVFVENTIVQSGATEDDAAKVHELVRNSVSTVGRDSLTDDMVNAHIILQPRIMKLGDSYVLTVERRRGEEIIYASQVKAYTIGDLDRAARRATLAALSGPASDLSRSASTVDIPAAEQDDTDVVIVTPRTASSETTTITRPGFQLNPVTSPRAYWSIGLGPFAGRQLETDDIFYNLSIGRVWDIDPRASAKILAEFNFATGEEDASLMNFGAGANWFFTADQNGAAYVTGDLGYGFANAADEAEADNFSFGAGVGYQFFRTSHTTLDLQLRYVTILEDIRGESQPKMLGGRLAVNF